MKTEEIIAGLLAIDVSEKLAAEAAERLPHGTPAEAAEHYRRAKAAREAARLLGRPGILPIGFPPAGALPTGSDRALSRVLELAAEVASGASCAIPRLRAALEEWAGCAPPAAPRIAESIPLGVAPDPEPACPPGVGPSPLLEGMRALRESSPPEWPPIFPPPSEFSVDPDRVKAGMERAQYYRRLIEMGKLTIPEARAAAGLD